MQIFYRISNQSYQKIKLPGIDKKFCLQNFLSIFNAPVTMIADRANADTIEMIKNVFGDREYTLLETELGNSGSFRFALDQAIALENQDETVYFVEDDYLHLKEQTPFGMRDAAVALEEGIQLADYVTLYDHPDKYEKEYNFFEVSKNYRTKTTHWRTTISSCLTFASKPKTIKDDLEIWHRHSTTDHPFDHEIFTDLKDKNRSLAVSIPGLAYHVDLMYSMQKQDVNRFLVPWTVDLAEKTLQARIEKKIGKKLDSSGYEGYHKLMLLEVFAMMHGA